MPTKPGTKGNITIEVDQQIHDNLSKYGEKARDKVGMSEAADSRVI